MKNKVWCVRVCAIHVVYCKPELSKTYSNDFNNYCVGNYVKIIARKYRHINHTIVCLYIHIVVLYYMAFR
jgi:hypothetical protein